MCGRGVGGGVGVRKGVRLPLPTCPQRYCDPASLKCTCYNYVSLSSICMKVDFADCLLTHAGLSDKKVARMKRRVKKAFEKKEEDENEDAEEGGKTAKPDRCRFNFEY